MTEKKIARIEDKLTKMEKILDNSLNELRALRIQIKSRKVDIKVLKKWISDIKAQDFYPGLVDTTLKKKKK